MHEPDPRADVRDVPDPFESGGPGGGSPGPRGRGGCPVSSARCGGADLPARLRGSQLLLAHDGGGPCPPRPSRPCGAARRRARRYPQNHVRGAQLGFDHQGRLPPSDLRGGVGPAQPARSIRTPGTPSRLAHGCDGAVAFFAADEPRGARSPTFFRVKSLGVVFFRSGGDGGVPLCGVSSGCGWFRGWLRVVEGSVADHGVQGEDAAVGQGEQGLAQGACPGPVCAGSRRGRRDLSGRRRRTGTWRVRVSYCRCGRRARRGSMSLSGV